MIALLTITVGEAILHFGKYFIEFVENSDIIKLEYNDYSIYSPNP